MKVLIYDNRKIDPIVIDASTEEAELAAFMALFKYLNDEWQVYSDLEDIGDEDARHSRAQAALYKKAIDGCAKSTRALLLARRSYEYEYCSLHEVVNPLELDQLPLR